MATFWKRKQATENPGDTPVSAPDEMTRRARRQGDSTGITLGEPDAVIAGEVVRASEADDEDEQSRVELREAGRRRAFWRRSKKADTTLRAESEDESVDAWAGLDFYQPRGAVLRESARKASKGRYAPSERGALTTTRQAGILNTALLAQPPHTNALAIGNDTLTRSMLTHDPFSAYKRKEITSPSVIILGVIGSGKSSLMKTVYVDRPLILHKRRVIQIDRKDQMGEGEYGELTRAIGGEPFKMVISNTNPDRTVLNWFDPSIIDVIGRERHLILVRALIERAGNGDQLDKWETEALRIAVARTIRMGEVDGREVTLNEMVPLLGNVDNVDSWGDFSTAAKERMHQAGLGLRFVLQRTISEEMQGLFDGPTSSHVNLDSKLTSFDISQLPQNSPSAGMVMAIAQSWALGRIQKQRGWLTYFNVEEGWDMVSGPIGRALKEQQLLARGLGLASVTAMHHIRQVNESDEGRAMLQEPQTVHLYRQEREEDVQACIDNFGLDPQSAETLRSQPEGHHLLKIGMRPEIPVAHVRSDFEVGITNTDNAMVGAQQSESEAA